MLISFGKHYFSPLNTFMRKGKDPDPYLCLTDPNPRGQKTCGFRYGSPIQNKAAKKTEKNEAAQIRSRILPDKVTTVRYWYGILPFFVIKLLI